MSKSLLLFSILLILFSSCNQKPDKRGFKADLSGLFGNDSGSFVLYDYNNRYYLYHNEELTKNQLSPGKTYIYPAALNYYSKYKSDNPFKEISEDSLLLNYFVDSAGLDIQKKNIVDLNYGNKDTSFNNNDFYYKSSLKISASEQVEFLKELYVSNSIFKEIKQHFVTDTVKSRNVTYILSSEDNISWCIGTVEYGSNLYIFALNLYLPNKLRALEITQNILYRFKILEE